MRSSRLGNISGSEGQSCNVTDSILESSNDLLSIDVKDGRVEQVTVVIDHLDLHLIEERLDLKFVKKRSLGASNLLTTENNLHVVNDFDLTLNNLGLDRQVLEERCLFGVETSGTGLYPHIIRSD